MLKRRERRWRYLTLEEVKEAAAQLNTETVWRDHLAHPMFRSSGRLAGKKMTFVFEESLVFSYEFESQRFLRFSASDGRGSRELYNACPAPGYDSVFFVHHYRTAEIPGCIDLIFDLETGCAVMIDAAVGHPDSPREVYRTIRFGRIEGIPLAREEARPHYTDDLTGKAIRWRHPGGSSRGIKYIFSSCRYYTYAMDYSQTGECWMATNPADYIKFKDDLYLCTILEERQTGVQLAMLMNLTLMTDIQSGFGFGGPDEKGVFLETFMRCGREGFWDEMPTDLFSEQ